MSSSQSIDEIDRQWDKNFCDTLAAQEGFSSARGQRTRGVKICSGLRPAKKEPLNEAPAKFFKGEEVYDSTERDSNGNLKKTKYWVCCDRIEDGIKEYRLKDQEPDNWDEVKCNGQHGGHWVAEGKLEVWD